MASKQTPRESVKLNLVWRDEPDLRSVHANHVWLCLQDGDAVITFGELVPPAPGQGGEQTEIQLRPVARVSLSVQAFSRMTKLLNRYANGESGADDGE